MSIIKLFKQMPGLDRFAVVLMIIGTLIQIYLMFSLSITFLRVFLAIFNLIIIYSFFRLQVYRNKTNAEMKEFMDTFYND